MAQVGQVYWLDFMWMALFLGLKTGLLLSVTLLSGNFWLNRRFLPLTCNNVNPWVQSYFLKYYLLLISKASLTNNYMFTPWLWALVSPNLGPKNTVLDTTPIENREIQTADLVILIVNFNMTIPGPYKMLPLPLGHHSSDFGVASQQLYIRPESPPLVIDRPSIWPYVLLLTNQPTGEVGKWQILPLAYSGLPPPALTPVSLQLRIISCLCGPEPGGWHCSDFVFWIVLHNNPSESAVSTFRVLMRDANALLIKETPTYEEKLKLLHCSPDE